MMAQEINSHWEQPMLPGDESPVGVGRHADADAGRAPTCEEPPRPLSLEGLPFALVDRVLPRSPRRFLAVVATLAVGSWLLALALAGDRARFLASHEWRAQPLFLACHLIALRLFVTVYARNFLAGTAHLNMPAGYAVRHMEALLRPLGGAVALLVAAPFCIYDFTKLYGDDYRKYLVGPTGTVGAADLLMGVIWCVEWVLNAYIWVLLVGFLLLILRVLKRYPFRAPIEIVLHEKQYRPFLLMSVQGATILLFFGVAYAVYVWYAQGELTDYMSLCITGVLLLLGFVPPWLRLKNSVEQEVRRATYGLRDRLSGCALGRAGSSDDTRAIDLPGLAARLDEALAMLRISYLERLHQELGKAEGKAILLRVLAPFTTIVWTFLRPLILGA
jgi:hypothetical protein